MLAVKIFCVAISSFSSSTETSAYEKSNGENKEEEESVEKGKKKLLIYESYVVDLHYVLYANNALDHSYFLRVILDSFPSKNIPTPPPDYCG